MLHLGSTPSNCAYHSEHLTISRTRKQRNQGGNMANAKQTACGQLVRKRDLQNRSLSVPLWRRTSMVSKQLNDSIMRPWVSSLSCTRREAMTTTVPIQYDAENSDFHHWNMEGTCQNHQGYHKVLHTYASNKSTSLPHVKWNSRTVLGQVEQSKQK